MDLGRQGVEERLDQPRQRGGGQIGMAQIEDTRGEAEELAIIGGVAEMGEGEQAAPGCGALQPGAIGDIGDREAGMLLVKTLDDRQALDQAIDDIAVAHDGSAEVGRSAHIERMTHIKGAGARRQSDCVTCQRIGPELFKRLRDRHLPLASRCDPAKRPLEPMARGSGPTAHNG